MNAEARIIEILLGDAAPDGLAPTNIDWLQAMLGDISSMVDLSKNEDPDAWYTAYRNVSHMCDTLQEIIRPIVASRFYQSEDNIKQQITGHFQENGLHEAEEETR